MSIGGKLRSGVRALGMMLVGEKLASEDQVEDALAEQRRSRRRGSAHRKLGEILVAKSVVSRGQVDEVLSRQEAALEIDSRVTGDGVCVLDVAGYVDGDTHRLLDRAFEAALDAGYTRIVVNATRLDYMNSDGIGAILPTARRVREEGGDLKIYGLHGKAAALFEVIGLEAFFEIAESEGAALAAFSRPVPEELYREPEVAFVGSSRGRVYHTMECKAVSRISVLNMLRFYSREEAESAGRKPCARCCGAEKGA
jgi:anti-sigma B factor antagonist